MTTIVGDDSNKARIGRATNDRLHGFGGDDSLLRLSGAHVTRVLHIGDRLEPPDTSNISFPDITAQLLIDAALARTLK